MLRVHQGLITVCEGKETQSKDLLTFYECDNMEEKKTFFMIHAEFVGNVEVIEREQDATKVEATSNLDSGSIDGSIVKEEDDHGEKDQ